MKRKTKTELLVEQCQQAFGNMETIPLSAVPKLQTLLEGAPIEALDLIVKRNIKFCVHIARRILNQRKAK
jgi:hypothetical protein